jgi:hypothetical protein
LLAAFFSNRQPPSSPFATRYSLSRSPPTREISISASSYDEALARLLEHEGGYSNHPSDPGGPTNWGITIFDYRRYIDPRATAADVRAMQVEVAKRIYREKYLNALRCDELPAGVDYDVFGYSVKLRQRPRGQSPALLLALPPQSPALTYEVIVAAGGPRSGEADRCHLRRAPRFPTEPGRGAKRCKWIGADLLD